MINSISVPHIAIEVNNSCNQDCIFCYNHLPHQEININSNYHGLIKVLRKLYSQVNVASISFTGGETLLEPRLEELILFAKMKKSVTTIISNGTLFSDERVKNLTQIKNDLYQLPIHSHKSETHDLMTGLKGSHTKSLTAIQTLKQSGANIAAVIVLTKLNIRDIAKTIELITDNGISQISVDRYNIGGKNKGRYNEILPEISELRESYSEINNLGKKMNLHISSNVCTPHCILDPKEFPFILFGNCPENPLHFPITININGDMRVCNHSPIIAGNIFKQKLPDIINSNYVKSWAENVPEQCQPCSLWKNCRGGCRAASEQTGGDNTMADPIIRIFDK
jgi:radical SAM protein with 4Fe4S-binding SPASM domain